MQYSSLLTLCSSTVVCLIPLSTVLSSCEPVISTVSNFILISVITQIIWNLIAIINSHVLQTTRVFRTYNAGLANISCFLKMTTSSSDQLQISRNPLTCDCRDYDVIAAVHNFTFSHFLDGVVCHEPPQLAYKRVSFHASTTFSSLA